jgi:peptide/nickel transport system permease protein
MRGSTRGFALTELQQTVGAGLPSSGPDPSADAVSTVALGLGEKPATPARLAWRRFRRHKLAMASVVVLLVLAFMCVFANLFTKYDPTFQIRESYPKGPLLKNLSPRSGHWFGTNGRARDMWANVLYGGRISLAVGLTVAIISSVIGTVIGVVAGYYGKWLDNVLMRVTDLFLAIPFLVSAIIVSELPANQSWAEQFFGQAHSLRSIITVMALFFWMPVARIIRGLVLSLKEKEFVEAARAAGASDFRIMFRHLVPNCTGQIIVNTTLAVAAAILTETALSFLGYGVDKVFTPTWGNLLSDAQESLGYAAHLMWFPALAVVITVLCVNFIGDGLRDALDPKQLSV